ncbi:MULTISPECIES: site-specific integrase [Bacteroidales]|uniref:site-specific integrase n=1 Tax=Bacteroidales TaxID=171549 RepID=UPI000472AE69|nr:MULTISPECIES: site-specific integrase [Porphyromonas]KGN81455.1 integrase [Porphyromonas gulae]
MRSTFKILFYINRSKTKADGTTAILCRITIDGSNVAMTTGESIVPSLWSVKLGETNDKKTNQRLQLFRERITQGYNALLFQYGAVSAELLKIHLQGIGSHPTTLLALSAEELKRQVGKRTNTYNSYRSCDIHLREFVGALGKEDIPIVTLTMDFFDAYRHFLIKRGYAPLSTNKFVYWLSRLMSRAVSQQTIRSNPFEGAKYERVVCKSRFLNRMEVARLLALPLQNEEAEFSRRIFIFSIFTGLAYSDVRSLSYGQIETNSEGKRYIRRKRQKTDVEALIPLHPIAEQILTAYPPKENNQEAPIFPTTQSKKQVWAHLKAIGLACGIRQSLSFHLARHSFGTLTLEAGIPIESIAKMMGHSSIASTQIYAQITDQKISSDMDRLIQQRNI